MNVRTSGDFEKLPGLLRRHATLPSEAPLITRVVEVSIQGATRPLTRALRSMIAEVGKRLDPTTFALDSGRTGGATWLVEAGVSETTMHIIYRTGRWRTGRWKSDTLFMIYIIYVYSILYIYIYGEQRGEGASRVPGNM